MKLMCEIAYHPGVPVRGPADEEAAAALAEDEQAGAALTAPSHPRRSAEEIARLLRRRIERGLMVPGQRVSQRDVAELFAISTTPVREAFQILQAQGFLRIDHNRGAVVVHPSPAEIREIYEIRKALEALAVTAAIDNLDASSFDRLEELVVKMRAGGPRGTRLWLNERFHAELYRAAGMPRLVDLIAQLRSAVSYYIERAYETADLAERAVEQHRTILAACRAGDRNAASAAMRDHLEASALMAVASARRLDDLDPRNPLPAEGGA
jgi:DNA-binding GntR family transcriptional regulator